jgi:drug/metabolite transporter (DMT)-like permease
MLIAIGTARGEWTQLSFSARSFVAQLYLTVAGSLGGYTAYTYALQHLPVSTVSLYAYVNPVIAVALGTIWLGEPFGWRVIVAAAMVLAGIGIVRTGYRASSQSAG